MGVFQATTSGDANALRCHMQKQCHFRCKAMSLQKTQMGCCVLSDKHPVETVHHLENSCDYKAVGHVIPQADSGYL